MEAQVVFQDAIAEVVGLEVVGLGAVGFEVVGLAVVGLGDGARGAAG